MTGPERKIQQDCEDLMTANGWYVDRTVHASLKGWPDTTFHKNGRVLYVEFKTKAGKLSSHQLRVISRLRHCGHEVAVVRGVEEMERVLKRMNAYASESRTPTLALRCNRSLQRSRACEKKKLSVACFASVEEIMTRLVLQDFSCAICGRHEADLTKNLALDHDHKTGKFRGWLCFSCNRSLGGFKDSPERLKKAYEYLRPTS